MIKPNKRPDARIQRLKNAIAHAELPGTCTVATMRSALATDEWGDYKSSAELCFGPVLTGSQRTEFARYKQSLRRGDGLYGRAVKLSLVGWQAMRRDVLSRVAGREYSTAWEILEQLLLENRWVEALLDRHFEDCAPDRESIARPWDSQSEFAIWDDGSRQRMLMQCQRAALIASLSRLKSDPPKNEGAQHPTCQPVAWDELFGFSGEAIPASSPPIDGSWFAEADLTIDDTSLRSPADDHVAM